MKLFRNKRVLRIVSCFLVITLMTQIVFPTVSMALTSGPTQIETMGYQPVDATDNVNLQTGSFNYTIPITSIPEYPMAINYHSGNIPDQEASMFGYGFNGFTGAISRNLMGLPDDINGATRSYNYSNKIMSDVSGTLTGALQIASTNVESLPGCANIGASVSLTIGRNSYDGWYGSIGLGMGGALVGGSEYIGGGIGGGIGLTSDSRANGILFGGGIGMGIQAGGKKVKTQISESFLQGAAILESNGGVKSFNAAYMSKSMGLSSFSSVASSNLSSLSPTAYVVPLNRGFGVSATVTYKISPVASISLTGNYRRMTSGNEDITKKCFGYKHLSDYDRGAIDNLADMTVEGENSFPDEEHLDQRNNPSYLQRDYFIANVMGLGGTMQLQQNTYGIVSRNKSRSQYRDIDLLKIKTTRSEVFPWKTVEEAKFNNWVDVIAILKGGGSDTDFDRSFFKYEEKASLTSDKHKFNGDAYFKMRGDMSGENDFGSSNCQDNATLSYNFNHVAGTGGTNIGFLRIMKNPPLYNPVPTSETSSKYPNTNVTKQKTSTVINTKNVSDLVSAYDPLPNSEKLKFENSFYTHYNYTPESNTSSNNRVINTSDISNNSNITTFNILSHLKTIYNGKSSTVGSIEVKNTNGLKYYFGLPVFAKASKVIALSGKGEESPKIDGDTYKSNAIDNRNKSEITDNFAYAYAWLLTAIVGDDYVDFDNIPGPSDGDLGFWVKFKYIKVADNYRWRAPFVGMEHVPGYIHTPKDDLYAASTGTKEIYYIAEMESSNYVCKYQYQKRFDGIDAKNIANGEAVNSLIDGYTLPASTNLGTNYQFAVTQIDLYKKHDDGENGLKTYTNDVPGTIVKSTKFYYDYSQCKGVYNNLANYMDVPKPPYHIESSGSNIETGKLTLRKVENIAYDGNNPITLPGYTFKYFGDDNENYNPDYNPSKVDRWGNYSKGSEGIDVNGGKSYYHGYVEYNKVIADESSKAWQLKQIALPSGGTLEVEYESQSYSYVTNKKAWAMRKIRPNAIESYEKSGDTPGKTKIWVDVSDIVASEGSGHGLEKIMSSGESVYSEIAFYRNAKDLTPGKFFMGMGMPKILILDEFITENGKTYQHVEFTYPSETDSKEYAKEPPLIAECRDYMYSASAEMRDANPSSNLNNLDNMEETGFGEALLNMLDNVKDAFVSKADQKNTFEADYGVPGTAYFAHLSFLRTPIYKGKYTGTRAKTLVFSDRYNYASENTDAGDGIKYTGENQYGVNYFFNEGNRNEGKSSGVVTIEPGGGAETIVDMTKIQGAGFIPSPAIYSSRTMVETKYAELKTDINSDGKTSREKGYSIYEFYTPKDDGYNYLEEIKQSIWNGAPSNGRGYINMAGVFGYLKITKWLKIPAILPLQLTWKLTDKYHGKSYAYTDYTDMYGRPKSIKQYTAYNEVDAAQEYTYYGKTEAIKSYDKSYNVIKNAQLGRLGQVWSEAYYTKESNIFLVPVALSLIASTKRNFCYTNMKYTYVPPIIKEIKTLSDGQQVISSNIGFDYNTGIPIEVSSTDSYNNTKIHRSVPAYWIYDAMGMDYEGVGKLNNLTAITGAYMYLKTVSNSTLLGASVTEWSKDGWNYIDYIQPEKAYNPSNPTQFSYKYTKLINSAIKGAYTAINSKPFGLNHSNYLYKPYRSYTYETDLNTGATDKGTFKTFTSFDYTTPANSWSKGWKIINTNELFDANGTLVQSKDILNKYVSQNLGYHFSNSISVVSNSPFDYSAYDGAENTYYRNSSDNMPMLEGDRFKLEKAKVYKAQEGTASMITKTFALTPATIDVLTIVKPQTYLTDMPFAKISIIYNHNNSVVRNLYVSINKNGDYEITSNMGESFDGFVVYPNQIVQGVTKDLIVFDPSVFKDNDNDNKGDFIVQPFLSNGFLVNSTHYNVPECTLNSKAYKIPESDVYSEVHTGKYGFVLKESNSIGTCFELDATKYTNIKRFKALVWVHVNSPKNTQLIAQFCDANTSMRQVYTSMSTPYVKAGNWHLLMLNIDKSILNKTQLLALKKIKVFVKNASESGTSIYDDIRVLPYSADMSNYVYDHVKNRVTSTLNEDHFATYSLFDNRGRVIEKKVEVQDIGSKIVKRYMYNNQKK